MQSNDLNALMRSLQSLKGSRTKALKQATTTRDIKDAHLQYDSRIRELEYLISGRRTPKDFKDKNKREKLEHIFKLIADVFNLTEGEVNAALSRTTEELNLDVKRSFKQLVAEDFEAFTSEELDYLYELGYNDPMEELLTEQSADEILKSATLEELTIIAIFTKFQNTFDFGSLVLEATSLYRMAHGKNADDAVDTIKLLLKLLCHNKVDILRTKDGEHYEVNLSAKVRP